MHPTLKRCSWILFILVLAACGGHLVPASSPTATNAPTLTTIPLVTSTLPRAMSALTSIPSLPSSTVSPTPLPPFPLDGYVMLFVKDSNLYFQDENKSPIKLTYIGKMTYDHYPLLSDDNKKVVFYRDDGNIYSINSDGTNEGIILSKEWLNSLGLGTKIGDVNFIPTTHELFFVAIQCKPANTNVNCPTSVYHANTDTREIIKLADLGPIFSFSNIEINRTPRNIAVSPDGKMIAIGTMHGVDLFAWDGKTIRDKILPYTPSTSAIVYPSLFWLPDSSGLIVAVPDTTYSTLACDNLPAHVIWRYTIADNAANQMPLDPPPMVDTFEISPDGKWIAYGGYCQPSLYLGNLGNGNTLIFGENDSHPTFSWSPDSKHLIIGRVSLLTTVGKPLDVIRGEGSQWIDSNHFICQEETALIAEIR